jgi:hypothetical protein
MDTEEDMSDGIYNLLVEVAATELIEIGSHSQVVVAVDVAAAGDDDDHACDTVAGLLHQLVSVSAVMPPTDDDNGVHADDAVDDDPHDHDDYCSTNDRDYPRRITVTRHEHPRWNRTPSFLVWPKKVEMMMMMMMMMHRSHMSWRSVLISAHKVFHSKRKNVALVHIMMQKNLCN